MSSKLPQSSCLRYEYSDICRVTALEDPFVLHYICIVLPFLWLPLGALLNAFYRLRLFIAYHCSVKWKRTVYAVDIFLMQHIMWEVYYNKIGTFRYMNICPYLTGVNDEVSLTVNVHSEFQ
jgi:hypothetical protein